MFTASMSPAEIAAAYNRLTTSTTGNNPTKKEVKICYVTVCFPDSDLLFINR